MINFVHLHVHDQFSTLDGYGTAKQYVVRANDLGFKSLAVTNHGSIDGCIKFQKECVKHDIKPIIGCEFYIVPNMLQKEKGEHRGHITVLAKGPRGWATMLRWLSKAHIDGFYRRPRIDYSCILTENIENLKDGDYGPVPAPSGEHKR